MSESSTSDRLKVALQKALPQHGISRAAGWLTRARFPKPLLGPVVRGFARLYGADLSEAEVPKEGFSSFDDFFTRPLKPGARDIDADPLSLVSPVDGRVSAAGPIEEGMLLQAKGKSYPVAEFVGNEDAAHPLAGGTFATLYLSPRDYHRMHAPCDLSVRRMVHLPGRLFSVNPAAVRARERLFSQNERVALFCEAPSGPLVVVFVGALIVGSIEVPWEGVVAPGSGDRKGGREWVYGSAKTVSIPKGGEIGRFHMGSTVVVLVPKETGALSPLAVDAPVRLGEAIGRLSGS